MEVAGQWATPSAADADANVDVVGYWVQPGATDNPMHGTVSAQPQTKTKTAMMAVVCPAGCGPGMLLQVQTPAGQLVQVNVPPGVMPGQQFTLQYAA